MKRAIVVVFGLCLCLGLVAGGRPVEAQGLGSASESEEPLEVDAEEGIEWVRDEKLYVARGNARAASGDMEVYADVLKAHYRDAETGGSEIYLIEAVGSVRIEMPGDIAYGDDAQYSLDQAVYVLRGQDLRFLSRDGRDRITARDTLEYWETKEIAVARGNAQAIHDDERINADVLVAHFRPGAGGGREIHQVVAEGNVRIRTPTDYATGNSGVYYVQQDLARLEGDVKITRDNNQLNGQYAEVNLATGISKLLGSSPGGEAKPGRVQGLIMPKAKPKSQPPAE